MTPAALCREGRNLEALDTLFAEEAESIEARGDQQMPAAQLPLPERASATVGSPSTYA